MQPTPLRPPRAVIDSRNAGVLHCQNGEPARTLPWGEMVDKGRGRREGAGPHGFMGPGQHQSVHVTLMHKDGTDVGVSAEWQPITQPSLRSPPTPVEDRALRQS